jgi:hypothetical protein
MSRTASAQLCDRNVWKRMELANRRGIETFNGEAR